MGPPDLFKLARRRVGDKSLKEYNRDLNYFVDWLKKKGKRPKLDPEEIDKDFTLFAIECFDDPTGHNKATVTRAKCALEHYLPECKGRLTLSDMSLQGWRKQVPVEHHEVCPEEMAYLIAFRLSRNGHLELAIGVLLSVDCYLRLGDLCSLKLKDVIVLDKEAAFEAAVVLEKTKTGRKQSALVRPAFLGTLLEQLISSRTQIKEDDYLMPVRRTTIAKYIKETKDELGFEMNITSHSFRYGGATADTINNRLTPDGVLERGRWTSKRTMQGYVKPAEYYRNLSTLSTRQREIARDIMKDPEHFFPMPAGWVGRNRIVQPSPSTQTSQQNIADTGYVVSL